MTVTASEIGAEMLGAQVRPMEPDESELMLRAVFGEKSGVVISEQEMPPIARILHMRLKLGAVPCNMFVVMILAYMSKGHPGRAVLYAAAVKAIYESVKHEVNMTDLCKTAFPMGFPTEAELNRIWELQKAIGHRPDNWLDYPEAWGAKGALVEPTPATP